jgi:hypothetical protein
MQAEAMHSPQGPQALWSGMGSVTHPIWGSQ